MGVLINGVRSAFEKLVESFERRVAEDAYNKQLCPECYEKEYHAPGIRNDFKMDVTRDDTFSIGDWVG